MELDYPRIVQIIIMTEKLQFTDIFNLSIKRSQVTKSTNVGNIISGNNTFLFKNANLKMYDHKENVHDLLQYCYSMEIF